MRLDGRGPAQVLQGFGGGLVFRVETALPVVDAPLAGIFARALERASALLQGQQSR